jgi:hypothetical protein
MRLVPLLFSVHLAALAITPVSGQGMVRAGGPVSNAPAPIPDLSGIWGRNMFHFGPPSSGPTPVVEKRRRPNGALVANIYVGDYSNPILRPQAAEAVRKRGELELSGTALPNAHNQCWPEPTPFALNTQFGVEVIQQKDEIILLYLSDHQVRRVRMNAPHSEHATPTWQGESVGHFEGDTLIVDTVGLRVGLLSMVDLYGTPFSAALHVIERYRLIDGAIARDLQQKHESTYFGTGQSSPATNECGRGDIDPDMTKPGLQVEITVDDPATFAMPWSAFVTYRRVLGEWPEAVCAENTRGSGSSWVSVVPQTEKPDF